MGQPLIVRDLDALTSWHADWSGLRTVVLGLGVTGFAAADTLAELGADVIVATADARGDRVDLVEVIGARLLVHPLDLVPSEIREFDPEVIVVSPGFHPDHPVIEWALATERVVWGDIELAWRLRDKVGAPAEWICITGTNGKTTTTQLTAAMLAADGKRVAPCGNIGVPVLDAIRDPGGFDFLVVELSSYQLHWVRTSGSAQLVPLASACLNLAEDHLDWHGSFAAYRDAKAKVYANTTVACVYNRDDSATMTMVEDAEVTEGCRAIGFGLGIPGPSDLGIVDGILCDRAFLDERRTSALEVTTLDQLAPAGLDSPHSVANVLAACALARAAGASIPSIRSALVSFRLDAHRTELVAKVDDISWVDDSKATNPHAADASLRSYDSVVWIAGGLFKGVEIDSLVRTHISRLRAAVIIGENRDRLREAFGRHAPTLPLFEVTADDTRDVMEAAVRFSASVAKPGDVVLLAPAAASMDQFASYADRGALFASAVLDHLRRGQDEHNTASSPGDDSPSGGAATDTNTA